MPDATHPHDNPLIPRHGGYRNLKTFQIAELVYDVTVRFCDRYISPRSRTHDQMVQAARSGVQNIAEGSQASGTSKKMEMKLTNVARASIEELRCDYLDFLRHRRLPSWDRDDPRRQNLIDRRPTTIDHFIDWTRAAHRAARPPQHTRANPGTPDAHNPQHPAPASGATDAHNSQHPAPAPGATDAHNPQHPAPAPGAPTQPQPGSAESTASTGSTHATRATYPEIAANGALALIAVVSELLNRQLKAQSGAFIDQGGFTERLYRVRRANRRRQ